MTWDELRQVEALVFSQAGLLGRLPLAEAEAFVDRADTLGPLLDPTGWQQRGGTYPLALRVLRAARTFVSDRYAGWAILEGPAALPLHLLARVPGRRDLLLPRSRLGRTLAR